MRKGKSRYNMVEWECIAFHAVGGSLCNPYTPMAFLRDLQQLPRRPTTEVSVVAGGRDPGTWWQPNAHSDAKSVS